MSNTTQNRAIVSDYSELITIKQINALDGRIEIPYISVLKQDELMQMLKCYANIIGQTRLTIWPNVRWC